MVGKWSRATLSLRRLGKSAENFVVDFINFWGRLLIHSDEYNIAIIAIITTDKSTKESVQIQAWAQSNLLSVL